jgi:hypothetical protein
MDFTDHRSSSRRLHRWAGRAISSLATSAALVAGLVGAQPASAATVTAVVSCNPCSSLSDLQTAANNWAIANGGEGTIILITSLNEPISQFFRVMVTLKGGRYANPITTTAAGVVALDNSIFARSSKLAPVIMPSDVPYNESDEVIAAAIENVIVASGPSGLSIWHMLMNFPQYQYYTMVDSQTGQSVQIWVGDMITVSYPGGYTEQWQFVGVLQGGSVQWKRVPNTLMLNGKPVTPPSTAPAAPSKPTAGGFSPYTGGLISLASLPSLCYGTDSVTTEIEGNTYTSYGFYIFPC